MRILAVLLVLTFFSCATKTELSRSSVEEKMEKSKSSFEDSKSEVEESKSTDDFEDVHFAEYEADKALNLLDKYILYNEALELASERNYPEIERIENKLIEVKNNLDITVEVISDIQNSLTATARKSVTNKGFKVSDIGYLTLLIEIKTKDVVLENEYYNKFWSLSISLIDAKDNIVDSKSFSGRESQITEDYLNSIILKEAEKRIIKYVKDLLP